MDVLTYTHTKPCIRGHFERYISNKSCVQCAKLLAVPKKVRYVKDKDRILEQNREWKRNNKDKVNLINRRRKLLTRNAEGSFTIDNILMILEEQDNQCPGCFRGFSKELPYTVDHFVPLIRGGTNHKENLQLMCKSCNSRKQASLWSEWKSN